MLKKKKKIQVPNCQLKPIIPLSLVYLKRLNISVAGKKIYKKKSE